MKEEKEIEARGGSLERLEAELAATRADRQEMMLRLKAGRGARGPASSHGGWWIVSAALAAAVISGGWLMVSEIQASAQSLQEPSVTTMPVLVDEPPSVESAELLPNQDVLEEAEEATPEEAVEAVAEPTDPRVLRRRLRSNTDRPRRPPQEQSPERASDGLEDLDRCGNDPLCGGF